MAVGGSGDDGNPAGAWRNDRFRLLVESVRDYRGVRPWARAPEARRRAQSP